MYVASTITIIVLDIANSQHDVDVRSDYDGNELHTEVNKCVIGVGRLRSIAKDDVFWHLLYGATEIHHV